MTAAQSPALLPFHVQIKRKSEVVYECEAMGTDSVSVAEEHEYLTSKALGEYVRVWAA